MKSEQLNILRKHLAAPDAFCQYYLNHNQYQIETDGSVSKDNRPITFDHLFDSLQVDYSNQLRTWNEERDQLEKRLQPLGVLRHTPNLLASALRQAIRQASDKARSELIGRLSHFEREDLGPITGFADALTGERDNPSVAVISHFVQQTKRHMLGIPVKRHIVPVLVGPQSCGKSTAIEKRLLEPFGRLAMSCHINQLGDRNYRAEFSNHFICYLPELGRLSKTELNLVKTAITAQSFSERVAYGARVERYENKASFIACSNIPVEELIRDETGMRRLFQINCQKRCDWDAINEIDYLALIQGIDPSPNRDYLSDSNIEILERQEMLRFKDTVETFIVDSRLIPNFPCELTPVPTKKLYESYQTYCQTHGYRSHEISNLAHFSKRLSALGLKLDRAYVDGSRSRCALVPKDFISAASRVEA